jgi:hypothetical protein
MKQQIKLMAEYNCFPLWKTQEQIWDNINPASLPLSKETIIRLEKWANTFDSTLNHDDPISSKFANSKDEEAFEQEGILICYQLQKELQPDHEIVYYSNKENRIISFLPNFDGLQTSECETANTVNILQK